MKKVIIFEEKEFKAKFIDFCNNFVEQSKKGYGVKLIANEDDLVLEDFSTIAGTLMLVWNDTFTCDE